MNDVARLRRAEMRHEANVEAIRAAKEICLNPIILMVVGVSLLEYLERKGYGGDYMTPLSQAGVITVASAQAIAPLVPDLIKGGAEVGGLIKAIKGG